jgi:hypothetical protein
MNVHEPATVVTDYLLALLTVFLGWRLSRDSPPPARKWFARVLFLSALSAFVGGSYHGWGPNVSPALAAAWWGLTLLTLSLVSACLAMSLMHEMAPVRLHGWIRTAIVVKLVLFAGLAVLSPRFLVAIVDYGTTLLTWLVAAVLARHRPWRGWMLAGIALSAIAAAVQQLRLAPSVHFNHNDLYHVVQGVAFIAFYRAGRLLGVYAG